VDLLQINYHMFKSAMICPGLNPGVRNLFRMVEDDIHKIRGRTFLLAEHNEMRLRNRLYFLSPEI
jgi:hypothetical protein